MEISKLITAIGALGAIITAALGVEGFIPAVYAPWAVLANVALVAVGKRLVETQALNNRVLSWLLIAVSIASVLAGAGDLISSKWATIAAGASAVLLAFARSVFNWQESDDDGGDPPSSFNRPGWSS